MPFLHGVFYLREDVGEDYLEKGTTICYAFDLHDQYDFLCKGRTRS